MVCNIKIDVHLSDGMNRQNGHVEVESKVLRVTFSVPLVLFCGCVNLLKL